MFLAGSAGAQVHDITTVVTVLNRGPVPARHSEGATALTRPRARVLELLQQLESPVSAEDVALRFGQHVNTVVTQIEPRPELLLLVSVYQGRLYLGIRPPGRDPLGPQTTEWIWMLNGP